MKRSPWIVRPFLLLFLSPCATFASSDINSLHSCVEALKSASSKYRRIIPPPLFHFDRKLHTMATGIVFLEENLTRLERKAVRSNWGPLDLFLVSNANESCIIYWHGFEHRARNLILLIVFGSLTLMMFVISGLLWNRPGVRGRPENWKFHKHAGLGKASDPWR